MSEFQSLIQKYLIRLSACIQGNPGEICRVDSGSAKDLFTTLTQSFQNYSLKESLKVNICSHVFNESYGLLTFLRRIILWKDDSKKNIHAECFKLLGDFLDLVSSDAVDYGPSVKDVCVLYVKRDVSAFTKVAALVTLSKVLELCHSSSSSNKMGAKQLTEDLFYLLSRGSKTPSTVKESVLILIGTISHLYPQDFVSYSERMLGVYLQEMKKQMNLKAGTVDFNTVSGCLLGLKEYLFNFTVSYTEDMDRSYEIFDCVRRAMKLTVKKLEIYKAALQLIAAHAPQFGSFLYDDFEYLYETICGFVLSINREVQKVAFSAAIALIKQVAEILPEKISENRPAAIKVFNFFMNQFKSSFLKSANMKELNVAVVGYGVFASSCKLLIDEAEVVKMMVSMIQRSEHLFFSDDRDIEEVITTLPSFLEAFSSIIAEITNVSDTLLFSLQKLIVFQIENFPEVTSTHQFLVSRALVKIFLVLQSKPEIFRGFLAQTVYQGLVRSFSHDPVVDLDSRSSEKSQESYVNNPRIKEITYKSYIPLWSSLLNSVQWKELNAIGIPLQERQSLREALYDEILNSVLAFYQKLDLTTITGDANKPDALDETTESSSDPMHGMSPSNMHDCRIFVNLVDFCMDFLIKNCTDLFEKWVYFFGRETIYYSTKHPFISGFYKLVSLNLNICYKIGYFKTLPGSTEECSDSLDPLPRKRELESSIHLFSKYSKEVAVRLQQFKDDLLASCLLVLLALPTQIIVNEMHILIPVLQNTFKLGLSYLPLISSGLDALQRWCQEIPYDAMKKYYPDILPLLNLIAYGRNDERPSERIAKPSAAALKRGRKMSAKHVKVPVKDALQAGMAEDSELMQIQLQTVRFLGSLGGECNKAILEHAFDKAESAAIAWDFENRQHLRYAVPFVDMKPEIYFDDFLPRVLELATTSSDRQIKVAAGEVLHSMVIYIVGRGSQVRDSQKQKISMESLYKHFFPGLLQLACDVDQVLKQMFRPLVIQMTHWFSHSKIIKSPESQIIHLALWDGVTHAENAALRDFSSLCLKEYFHWTIKQSGEDHDIYAKQIFKKMCSFAIHPSHHKRIGAALVFNNIYTVFRNEEALVEKYTLELLVQFVESLAIAHEDDKLLGTQKLCKEALDHIKRICVVKAACFASEPANCNKPACLEEGDMKSATLWIFQQCGRIQTECRHKCMELLNKFTTLVPGIKSTTQFIDSFLKKQNICKTVFESRLSELGVPPVVSSQVSVKIPISWLEALMATLECYYWAFNEGLLVGKQEKMLEGCKVFDALEFFLREIICKDLQCTVHFFVHSGTENAMFSPKEMMDFNWTKCTVLLRLFTLFVSLCKSDEHILSRKFDQYLWNESFWEVVFLSALDPGSLGFNTTDPEVAQNLPREIAAVLQSKKCQEESFKTYCWQYLSSKKYHINNYLPVRFDSIDIDTIQLSELFCGCKLLVTSDLWPDDDYSPYLAKEGIVEKLISSLWDNISGLSNSSNVNIKLSPSSFNLAVQLLDLCNAMGVKARLLVSKLLGGTLSSSTSQCPSKRGIAIYSCFEEKFTEIMCDIADSAIPLIVSCITEKSSDACIVLTKFLACVVNTRLLRKRYGTVIINELLGQWDKLCSAWNNKTNATISDLALSVMANMILMDSDVALNTSGKYSISLLSTYVDLLKQDKASLEFKVHALDLLPFFIDSSEDRRLIIKNSLEMLVATHFPIDSKELAIGSFQYNTYMSAVKKLLSALELTGSCAILEILTIIFCKEENHPMDEHFQNCLNSIFKRLPPHNHQGIIEVPFKLAKPGQGILSPHVQLAVFERVCLPLMKRVSYAAFINFYLSNIVFLMDTLKQRKSYNVESRKIQIVAKINAMRLMELLYTRLTKDHLHSAESEIVRSYVGARPDSGKELTTDLTKMCLEFKKDNTEVEESLRDLNRIFCCMCFNALIAVICCTQTEIKFYNAFIFKENIAKGERIWENIVDLTKEYKFDIELDGALSRKKQFVAIRHKVRAQNEGEEDYEVESSLHMMASQHLKMSSLADDVSKFDFSVTGQVFTSQKDKISDGNQSEKDEGGNIELLEVESDELNQHECILPLTLLFKHMFSNQLIPEEIQNQFPPWLESIVANLEDPSMNKNVKLLLARIIISNAKILKSYGKYLLKPLMNLITSKSLGNDLNYFTLDVVITMLSWAPDVIPEESSVHHNLASCLLEFLVRRCGHVRRDIFRNNLEVVKTLVECWKGRMDIPYSIIYEQMKSHDLSNKDSIVGIQLLGVILQNDLPPYPIAMETECTLRLNVLITNLNNKYKEVYASASEVIGLIFKFKSRSSPQLSDDPLYMKLVERLSRMRSDESDKFLLCLHIIHLHYPAIAFRFMSKLVFLQPSVHGDYQNYALALLCACVGDISDGFSQLKSLGIYEQVEHKEEAQQYIILQAIEKVASTLSSDDILHLLPVIVPVHCQPSVKCRSVLFKILMILYDRFRANDGAKEKEIARLAQETLLKALGDSDVSVRLTVDNFWSSEERLPVQTRDRLLALMNNMYSPPTEDTFLQYATFLLLERTSHSPDYKRKIFEQPLSDCNFLAFKIATSWRQRYAPMTPLFIDSASSSLSSTLDASTFGNVNVVRATAPDQGDFSATLDTTMKSSTFNWLTNKNVDTFQSLPGASFDASFSSTKSHLLSVRRTQTAKDVPLKDKETETDVKGKSSVWLLKRRFLKDKTSESNVFARREVRRKDMREEQQREQKKRREAEVTMYRQYRIGELPDIEIPNSAIIAPLQALAQNDAFIAKQLFKSLVLGICKHVEDEEPGMYGAFVDDICTCMCRVLRDSNKYVPAVISFCVELLHCIDYYNINPEDVFVACLKSNQQSIGILLLETRILKQNEQVKEPRKKKPRVFHQPVAEDTEHWIKLAGLHKSVYEYDVCNGIFSHIMHDDEESQRALQLEASGEYTEAVKLYEKLYGETSEETDQAKKDLWDTSELYCYNQLTQWQNLESTCTSRFTSIEDPDLMKIWEESYFIDNYLPYMIRSKLKILMEGKNEQTLLNFIDQSFEVEERKAHIEDHFVEELALLHIIQNNLDTARYYSSLCLRNFIKDWKSLSPLAVGVRQSKLQNLQKYVELEEFLNLVKKDKINQFKMIEKTVCNWQERSPSSVDPLNIWDDIVFNRKLYLQELEGKYGLAEGGNLPNSSLDMSQNDSPGMEVDEENAGLFFTEKCILFQLSYAEYCTLQDNVSVALKNLKRLMSDIKKLDESYWKRFIGVYCLANYRKAKKKQGEERIEILLNSLSQLGKVEVEHGLDRAHIILKGEVLQLMSDSLANEDIDLPDLKTTTREKILKIADCQNEEEVLSSLHVQSYNCLTRSVSLSGSSNAEAISHAHMKLADFCNKYLRKLENEEEMEDSIKNHCSSYSKVLVESLLTALRQGSAEAIQLFPRLLQVVELYPSILPNFIEKSSGIPVWMFLSWINQMLAILDKPEASSVHSIVENIVLLYPNAIVYSFNLSYENYTFPKSSEGSTNRAFVQKMKAYLIKKNRLITDFMSALNHLSVPHVLFKEYLLGFMALLPLRKKKKEEVLTLFKEMWEKLFAPSEQNAISVGPIQKKIAGEFSNKVLKVCGKDGSRLFTAEVKNLTSGLKDVFESMKDLHFKLMKKELKSCSLNLFSPWLSEFQPWKYDTQIEIPGQYTGKTKPLPEYHVKIAGFDDKVLILDSITLPRRITIRGNDEKEYKVLVKCGEDLRQDSRIQQLFSVMNDIYAQDVECGHHRLKLTTYKVIPLSSKLGLIEWVDDTVVLQNFIMGAVTEDENKKFQSRGGIIHCCREELAKWGGNLKGSPGGLYHNIHGKKSRDESVKKFEDIVRSVPHGLLKRAFLKLSSSPEAFVRLRTQFATSHAVISVSQWLLGIGDRHLGNFLIDMTSGQEIGIDFGHAFGSATQFLTIPELVPFRLTPQYLQLMEPLKEKGTIELTMVHALSALRRNSSLLLNIMDIFIKEPTVDWQANARKQQQTLGLTDEEVNLDANWYPKQRVQIALKKLHGANPALVMRKELELGHGHEELFKKYEAVCLGDDEHNVRAKFSEHSQSLTVDEQVSCLIDQATDPHVLCKTYFGWNPWL